MRVFGLVLVLGYCALQTDAAKQIPSFVKLCKRNDPNLNECWKEGFETVVSHLGNGLPEMNLQPINPVVIEKVAVDYGNGSSVSLNAVLTNLKLHGLTVFKLNKVNIDLDNGKFHLDLSFPSMYLESDYKANGKILLLQFDSDGLFKANMTNSHVTGNWVAEKFVKKGKEHFKFTNSDLNVEIKKFNIVLENLFRNNKELTDSTNNAINENIDILYDELKPIIEDTIKSVIIDGVNNVYNLFPLDVLYPK